MTNEMVRYHVACSSLGKLSQGLFSIAQLGIESLLIDHQHASHGIQVDSGFKTKYVLCCKKLFHEGIGHIGLTDIGHAAIYVCGIFFLLLLSILAIILELWTFKVDEIKITARKIGKRKIQRGRKVRDQILFQDDIGYDNFD